MELGTDRVFQLIDHRYFIKEKLGEGGMGVVYQAQDTRLLRTVAIKILRSSLLTDDKVLKRFLLKARAASSLNLANICTIYDAAQDGVNLYIVMEYAQTLVCYSESSENLQVSPDGTKLVVERLLGRSLRTIGQKFDR